jgi:hypothetical protein
MAESHTNVAYAIPILEWTITDDAIEVLLGFMVAKVTFIIESFITMITLMGGAFGFGRFRPMVQIVHVLLNRPLAAEVTITSVTLKIWRFVTSSIHVLLA